MARRKTGEGSWGKKIIKGVEYEYFRKSYNGKLKYFYGKNQKEIKAKVKTYEKTINLNSEKTIQKMSFFDYATKWLTEEKKDDLALKTYDNYENYINNQLKGSELGDTQIGIIITMEKKQADDLVKRFFDDIAARYSSSLVNTGRTVINQVFEYGIEEEVFGYNPMARMKKPKFMKAPKTIVALDNDELELLWNEVHRINTKDSVITGKEGTPVYGIPAYLALFIAYTGLRFGEAAGFHREYANREEKYATINSQVIFIKDREEISGTKNKWVETLPKGNKTRIIPLADRAIEIIEMMEKRYPEIKRGTLQFSRTGNPVSQSNLNRVLKSMCKRAGITKEVTPHVLRHTFASILLNEDDKSLPVISEILGHSSVDVTYNVYIDIFLKKKMKTIDLFNNLTTKKNADVNTENFVENTENLKND